MGKGNEKTRKKIGKNLFGRFSRRKNNSLVNEKNLPSAARLSKTPQLDHCGLSYAGQHLLLIIQHHVDAKKIKVSSTKTSWETFVNINSDVNLVEKKNLAKEICNIHHFSHKELDEIASRVSKFVKEHQSHLVNF